METIVGGNIFIRKGTIAKAGEFVEGHKHNFDHVTIIRRGRFLIEQLDDDHNVVRSVERGAIDGHVLIKAGVEHKLTALEDDSVYWCIYAHRTPQGEIVEQYDGWEQSYM